MTDVRTPPANAPRTWDFLLTGFLVFIEIVLVVVFALAALAFGALNAGCTTAEVQCDETAVQFGQLACTFGPPLIAIVTIPIAIVRVLRRRIAFPVAGLGAVLMVLVFLLGRFLIDL
jgi:hypothetical protein